MAGEQQPIAGKLGFILSIVTFLFVIGLIIFIFSLFGGSLIEVTAEETSGSLVNESQTFSYNSGSGTATSLVGETNLQLSGLGVHRSGLMYSLIAGNNYTFPNDFGSGGSVDYLISATDISGNKVSTFSVYDFSLMPSGIKRTGEVWGSKYNGINFTTAQDIYIGGIRLGLGSRQGSLTGTCYYSLILNNQSTGLPNAYPTWEANTSFNSGVVPTGSSTGATFITADFTTPVFVSAGTSYSYVVSCPTLTSVDRIYVMTGELPTSDIGDVVSNNGGASWFYQSTQNKTAFYMYQNDTHYEGNLNVTCDDGAGGSQLGFENNPQGHTPVEFTGTLPAGCLINSKVSIGVVS